MKNVSVNNNISSFISLNNLRLKKKSAYFKKVIKYISQLKTTLNEKKSYNKSNFLPAAEKFGRVSTSVFQKKSFMVLYSICFSFSPVNTFLYIVDSSGLLKVRYSAGLLDFTGKAKKSRFQILKIFFKELRKLKRNFLKNKPIALHLENVGPYKHLIIRNLKKTFFV